MIESHIKWQSFYQRKCTLKLKQFQHFNGSRDSLNPLKSCHLQLNFSEEIKTHCFSEQCFAGWLSELSLPYRDRNLVLRNSHIRISRHVFKRTNQDMNNTDLLSEKRKHEINRHLGARRCVSGRIAGNPRHFDSALCRSIDVNAFVEQKM